MSKADGRVSDPRKGKTSKPEKTAPAEVDPYIYRSRPTLPGPFGDVEPPTEGRLGEVLDRADADAFAGMAPVVEYRMHGSAWLPWRRPLTIAELAQLRLAHEENGKWIIDPKGQQMLRLAAAGQLPADAWPTRRPSSS